VFTVQNTITFGKRTLISFNPRSLSAEFAILKIMLNLVSTFADRGRRMVSSTDPYGRILGFLDRSRYFFFQVAHQLYSRGWVDPVPDPLLLRKSGSAENRTRDLWICSQKLWPLDHRGGRLNNWRLVEIWKLTGHVSGMQILKCLPGSAIKGRNVNNLYTSIDPCVRSESNA
jgi:hypothetical protein